MIWTETVIETNFQIYNNNCDIFLGVADVPSMVKKMKKKAWLIAGSKSEDPLCGEVSELGGPDYCFEVCFLFYYIFYVLNINHFIFYE